MTREEEIKARLENDDYMDPGKFLDQAPDDLRYILARNEELQRRVDELESTFLELQDDPYVYNVPRLVGLIQNALNSKEHPDA